MYQVRKTFVNMGLGGPERLLRVALFLGQHSTIWDAMHQKQCKTARIGRQALIFEDLDPKPFAFKGLQDPHKMLNLLE